MNDAEMQTKAVLGGVYGVLQCDRAMNDAEMFSISAMTSTADGGLQCDRAMNDAEIKLAQEFEPVLG